MRTIAPAKINWTLEVLGRREDGYHEIRSVMQTIDLCDEVAAEPWAESKFETVEGKPLAEDDLIVRAARALEERVGRALPTRIRIEKRIPVASGLGGGSSDASAVLRLLNRLHELGLSDDEMAAIGATVGSDVPFFVYGGTALVEGRGERVTPLPDVEEAWFTIVVPRVDIAEKTRRMYEALGVDDYTEGSLTDKVVGAVFGGVVINERDMCNVFERHAYEIVPQLEEVSHGLFMEGLSDVHLVGAGPSIFVYCDTRTRAEWLGEYAESLTGDLRADEIPEWFLKANTFVARALEQREATSIADARGGSAH